MGCRAAGGRAGRGAGEARVPEEPEEGGVGRGEEGGGEHGRGPVSQELPHCLPLLSSDRV